MAEARATADPAPPPGEFELIAALRERIAAAGVAPASARLALGSGDDAAVTAGDGAAVTSVDLLVEGVHFDRRVAPLRAIGHKALAAALSDLAAMGAEAGEAYIQLALPEDLDRDACLELADGLAAVAARHRVSVAGGDISRGPVLVVGMTVVGYVAEPARAISRAGARPGDGVVVTGELGGAAAGLLALRDPELERGLDPEVAAALRSRQLEPEPRLAAGIALAGAGARAMIDLSDGLGADAGHVAAASEVGIGIELGRLPVQAGVAEVAGRAGVDAIDLAAARGEDYELLACVPADRLAAARTAVEATGLALAEVGAVREGAGVALSDPSGRVRPAAGFDQLASRRGRRGRI